MTVKTYQPTSKNLKREWHLIDVKGQILGRISTQIAKLLMGKHKPSYSNNIDVGDYVVIINSKDVELTGRKKQQKLYKKHSGYPGGYKEVTFNKQINENPEKVIIHAVSGMLPNNRLKAKRLSRMKVFTTDKHPFEEKFKKDTITK